MRFIELSTRQSSEKREVYFRQTNRFLAQKCVRITLLRLQGLSHVPHRSVCGALLAAPMACGTRAVRVPRLAAVLGDRSVALVDQVAVLRVQAVALLQRSK